MSGGDAEARGFLKTTPVIETDDGRGRKDLFTDQSPEWPPYVSAAGKQVVRGMYRSNPIRIAFILVFAAFAVQLCPVRHVCDAEGGEPAVKVHRIRSSPQMKVTARYGRSLRGTIGAVPVLLLRGSPEEMGEAHGFFAARDIIAFLDRFLIPCMNSRQPDAWERRVLPGANAFLFDARYQKELEGIMTGIVKALPNTQDRWLASIHREIRLADLHAENCLGDFIFSQGCSSFSAWGSLTQSGQVICGRNLDGGYIPGKFPFFILAREPVDRNRLTTLDITCPGAVGVVTCMNEDGLFFMGHDEVGLESLSDHALTPRSLVIREAAETSRATDSMEKIALVFKNRSVHMGDSTHVGLPRRRHCGGLFPFVVEWDASPLNGGATIRTEDSTIVADAIVCTNNFVNRRIGDALRGNEDSRKRFRQMATMINEYRAAKKKIDVDRAIDIMDSVAAHGESVTYMSVIAIPRERKIFFALSPGGGVSATQEDWMEIRWSEIFGIS